MKAIIAALILLISTSASAQVKQNYPQYGSIWNRVALRDSGAFQLPKKIMGIKDFHAGLDTAQMYYDPADSSLKYFTGYQWLSPGGGSISDTMVWKLLGNDLNAMANDVDARLGTKSPHPLRIMTNDTVRAIIPDDGLRINNHDSIVIVGIDTVSKNLYLKTTGGGSSYTFPYSVIAPGNAIQLENDTSAAAPGYFYGFNEAGRRGFYLPPSYTVGNGLSLSGSEFKLGGTLTEPTVITGDATNKLVLQGYNASNDGYLNIGQDAGYLQFGLGSFTPSYESEIYSGNLELGLRTSGNIYLEAGDGAVITGGLKLTGIPYDAGLYSVRIDGSGNISYYDTTTGGGGGTPAGNFGNVQINRNGAFATPGSDSLDFESATGLTVKGGIRGTTLGVNVAAPTSTYAAQINGDATYTTMLRLNTAESYPKFISMETGFGQNAYFGGTFKGVDMVLPLSDGSFAVSRGANNLVNFNLEDGLKVGRRLQTKQGADVASANNVTLGGDGSVFEITGTTTINLIANTNWQNGSEVTLLLENGITVSHNTASSGSNITILLAGAANFTTTAPSVLKLLLSEVGGTQAWREVSRTVF